jgi:hypothetical protein
MTSEHEFEKDLFAAFGEPAVEWAEGGVTERVLREIDRERRTRIRVMSVAALAGGALSVGLLATFAGPLVTDMTRLAGAPPALLWAVLLLGAASFSWATARLAVEA